MYDIEDFDGSDVSRMSGLAGDYQNPGHRVEPPLLIRHVSVHLEMHVVRGVTLQKVGIVLEEELVCPRRRDGHLIYCRHPNQLIHMPAKNVEER